MLPNNGNVIMSAEQAADHASKKVRVVPTRSLQAGLAALSRSTRRSAPRRTSSAMTEAVDAVATGAVTIASRDVQLNGVVGAQGQVARPRERRARRGRRDASTRSCTRCSTSCSPSRAGSSRCSPAKIRRRSTGSSSRARGRASRARARRARGRPAALPAPAGGRVTAGPRHPRRGQRHLPRDARAALRPARRDRGRRERRAWATGARRSSPS